VSIGGVSLGATVGASKAELIGEVKNLKQPSDIAGAYAAVPAGWRSPVVERPRSSRTQGAWC